MRNVARQEKNPIAIAQSSRVRQLLRGRLRASRAQLIETRTEAPGEPLSLAEVTDTKDCAEREQRSQTVAAAAKRLAAEIAATLAALDRLEDGRYGVCVDCGAAGRRALPVVSDQLRACGGAGSELVKFCKRRRPVAHTCWAHSQVLRSFNHPKRQREML